MPGLHGDVLVPECVQKATDTILRDDGQVDCLVNAAGWSNPKATASQGTSFFDLPLYALKVVVDLN